MGTYNNLKKVPVPDKIENFRQMITHNAEKYGSKALYIYKEHGDTLLKSYKDFYRDVSAFTTGLYKFGLNGKTVAVIGDTHPSWLTAFYSVIISGGVIVPLDHELDLAQITEFMKISECSAIVYTSAMNDKIEQIKNDLDFVKTFIPVDNTVDGEKTVTFNTIIEMGKNARESGDTVFENVMVDLDKMSALLFTSGTTGTSKGVMLSHKNLVAAANSSCLSTQYDSKDSLVSVLPIHHTYELTTGHIAASNLGFTVYICEGARYATRAFKEYKPTTLILVPLYLETIHKKIWSEIKKKGLEKKVHGAIRFSDSLLRSGIDRRDKLFGQITSVFGGNLKSIVVGGAPIDPQIVKDFYSFGISVFQGYGITECAPLVAVNRPGKIKFDSVGQVVDGCKVRIDPIDDSVNGEGEILVKGDNVMLGYLNDEAATAEVLTEDGYFRTGDIGTLDKKDYIRITGRKKNVIITSTGKNVYPEELEERLNKLPAVKESAVISRTKESANEQEIVAVIVPDYDFLGQGTTDAAASIILKESIAQINRALPPYKHIDRFEIRHKEFEKTLTKKIKRFLIK